MRSRAIAGFALVASCSAGSDLSPGSTATAPPAQLAFISQPSTATSGTSVAPAVTVAVEDAQGSTVTSASNAITLTITSGTGASGAALSGSPTVAAVAGIATFSNLSIDKASQGYTLTASTNGLKSGVSAAFAITPGPAAAIVIASADSQATTVASPVPTPPAVKVADAAGNGVSGATVVFAVASGGGSVTGGTQTTNAAGVATVGGWSIGPTVGANTLTASVSSVPNSTVTFIATGTASGPAVVAVSAGDNQSATVGSAVATPPAVKVVDAYGNAVGGVSVSFAIVSGGGSVTGATQLTNGGGVATVGAWTLGPTAGTNTLTASAPGLSGSPLSFAATGVAANASTIAVNAGDNQSAVAGTAVPTLPSVKIADVNGNPVTGAVVTFSVASGGGSITGASATTNTSGVATVGSWTLGTTSGTNTLTASAPGVKGPPVTFTASGTAGAAAKLVVTTSPSTSPQDRTAFPTQPAVQVQDANGNAVPQSGTAISAAITSGGGTLGGTTTVTTGSSGTATFTNLSITGTVGSRTITFTASGLSGVSAATANVTLVAGAATTIGLNSGNAQTATVGTSISTAPSVKVTDADGNAVSGVGVTFAANTGSGSVTNGTPSTNASGIAAVGSWTIGTTAGADTLTASAPGLSGSPVTITATGTAGAATQYLVTSSKSTIFVADTITLTAQLADAYGNAVAASGRTVSWSASGWSFAATSTTTTSSGATSVTVVPSASGKAAASDGSASGTGPSITVASFASVSQGGFANCALTTTGAGYCWGQNGDYQLTGTGPASSTPIAIAGARFFQSVSSGGVGSCAIEKATNATYCWGYGYKGDGNGNEDPTSPVQVSVPGGHTFQSVTVGGEAICGIAETNDAYCWGANASGTVGDSTTTDRRVPTLVVGGHKWLAVAAGYETTCGIESVTHKAYCWGGILGNGTNGSSTYPAKVTDSLTFQAITLAKDSPYVCALSTSNDVYCWGGNGSGNLGNGVTQSGNPSNAISPVLVIGGLKFQSIAAAQGPLNGGVGGGHTCGVINGGGAVYCWGANANGELGDGTTTSRTSPTLVLGGLSFTSVTAGPSGTCALASTGAIYCWGYNGYGQVGDATTNDRSKPSVVHAP